MSTAPLIAFVCPTYGAFVYARRALSSFLRTTPGAVAVVVDDASPDWGDSRWQDWLRSHSSSLVMHRFRENGGLTRSWNWGIRRALELRARYVVAGNSDVLFCEGWYDGLTAALEAGYALAGPLSNAPGPTSSGLADVTRYDAGYRLSDDPAELDRLARRLRDRYYRRVVESRINGFFQMARSEAWWAGRYDETHVYRPRNDLQSGRPNPTPLMTGNEDELQDRWARRGWRFAVCPSSFIFHYRSATRGQAYCHGLWARLADERSG